MDIGIAIVTAAGMYVGWQAASMAVRMRWTSTVGERQRREELEATRMPPSIEVAHVTCKRCLQAVEAGREEATRMSPHIEIDVVERKK